jgi:RimJ/RimL family protein N-acetyltransferase
MSHKLESINTFDDIINIYNSLSDKEKYQFNKSLIYHINPFYHKILLYILDNKPIGFIVGNYLWDFNNPIIDLELIINPGYRNRGYATKLLNEMINYIVESKISKIISYKTDINNYPSINFIEKNNFSLYKKHKTYLEYRKLL